MGKQLVEKLVPKLHQMQWPQGDTATEQGRETFEVGLDKVDSYSGDPKTLAAALRIFQTGDSQPFACAGVAYTLITAAREKDGSYAKVGLDAAMEWLEKAQENEPDVVDINVIEALVYIFGGRLEDARLILDYLQNQNSSSYHLRKAEIAYWESVRDLEETIHWFKEASNMARTVPQRLRLLSWMGDIYMQFDKTDEALKSYKEALHFNKDDAKLWHGISMIYWRQEDYDEAERFNRQALKIEDLPAARRLEEEIKKKRKSGTGVIGRFRRR